MNPVTGAPAVGMVGGGQLARMTAAPATALGIDFVVVALDPREPAAQVVREVVLGRHDDLAALEALADRVDVVTFDHEHVPPEHLRVLQERGVAVRPGPGALAHAQDKGLMRAALDRIGIPVPRWAIVESAAEIADAVGLPAVLKVTRGGYDGRGVWVVDSTAEAARVMADTALAPGARWLAEEHVAFDEELSAQVARSPHGQAVAYPVVSTVQEGGMCARVIAPAPGLDAGLAGAATEMALRIAGELDVVGMLAVEMFRQGDRLLVNELAMRPHNSGHWTIEGAVTSQFENHLRAVLDLPLGDPRPVAEHAVMVNVIGPDTPVPPMAQAYRHILARDPGLHVHLYGKESRPRRKLGHVTVVGHDLPGLIERAQHAADYLTGAINE